MKNYKKLKMFNKLQRRPQVSLNSLFVVKHQNLFNGKLFRFGVTKTSKHTLSMLFFSESKSHIDMSMSSNGFRNKLTLSKAFTMISLILLSTRKEISSIQTHNTTLMKAMSFY